MMRTTWKEGRATMLSSDHDDITKIKNM